MMLIITMSAHTPTAMPEAAGTSDAPDEAPVLNQRADMNRIHLVLFKE